MSARVTVVGDTADPKYIQHISSGSHQLVSDEPLKLGGGDAGPAPFDYLLTSLGSCTSITLRMYAERKGWSLGVVTVKLEFRRENDVNRITREISISAALTEEQRAKLADISERTPVTLAIKQGVAIETRL